MARPILFLFFLIPLFIEQPVATDPLSTNSRWIVDGAGRRVKLACVNWVSHLEAVVVEGLSKQPLDNISKKIAAMGFNCVRLTWPLFLATNASLASLTVRRSFLGLGLVESAAAVEVNNPGLIDLPLIKAFQEVVFNLGSNNLMVILDNQISKPGWCCTRYDDNGFFGDKYFDPEEWIEGLTLMAKMFDDSNHVVGMSLRNELRGPRQNVIDWYRYMQRGAEAVHAANPNVLVIFSGLDYDKDLSFLSEKKVDLTFTGKHVYELHWYGFSDGGDWENGNPNEVCGSVVANMTRKGYFLLEEGWPLFLSEFGVDQRGKNVQDNRYLSCMLGVAAELDLDWALWSLQGSYYLREGMLGLDETYGLLRYDWCGVRNSNFLQRISALQSPIQGPGLSTSSYYNIIFHPLTGLCILRQALLQMLQLGPCAESEAWSYTTQNSLILKGPELCMQAEGVGKPAKLGDVCSDSSSTWNMISDSKMHLASVLDNNGSIVCLDVGSNRTIVTAACRCLSRKEKSCYPDSQWFKIVRSNRNVVNGNLLSSFSSMEAGQFI